MEFSIKGIKKIGRICNVLVNTLNEQPIVVKDVTTPNTTFSIYFGELLIEKSKTTQAKIQFSWFNDSLEDLIKQGYTEKSAIDQILEKQPLLKQFLEKDLQKRFLQSLSIFLAEKKEELAKKYYDFVRERMDKIIEIEGFGEEIRAKIEKILEIQKFL